MKIAVAGVGYVGLSLAVFFAQNHEVIAVTTTPEKAEKSQSVYQSNSRFGNRTLLSRDECRRAEIETHDYR